MKSYKIEMIVNDHDCAGADGIKTLIEDYSSVYIAPMVLDVKEMEIGEWSDDHPLNSRKFAKSYVDKIFPNEYKQEYETLRDICSRIYYARIAGCEKTVIECLKDIDNYFREPNMN
jgi:hypothetical protein